MARLTLKSKIALLFSVFSTLIIVLTGFLLSLIYYYLVESDIKSSLIKNTQAIISEQIVVDQGTILFKTNDMGETISAKLRSLDMSAVVFDKNLQTITAFGVFRNSDGQKELASPQNSSVQESVLKMRKPVFEHFVLSQNLTYEVLTYPIVSNGELYGIIQSTREASYAKRLLKINFYLLIAILPFSILASWLVGYIITKKSFLPLDRLISHMKSIKRGKEPERLDFEQKDEIGNLNVVFSGMMEKINEGIQKQKGFIENASHELKTPLTYMASSLDLALLNLKEGKAEKSGEEIKKIKEDLFELNKIIESLLSLSQIQQNNEIKKDPVDILEKTKKILLQLERNISDKKIKVIIKSKKGIIVLMPKDHLTLLMKNLISNAIKYSRESGKINISFKKSEERAVIEIEDFGIGMDFSEKRHIFERFFRGKEAQKIGTGSGLGLALVKSICAVNNLKIAVFSKPNHGTKVVISNIPLYY